MQPSKQRTETGPSRLTDQRRRQHAPPRGFTLVEVLTVIVIIGILAALLVPAVMGAISRAKSAAMRMEVDGLSQAVEAYQLKYGDYPPDFSDWNLVLRHYKKIFPDIQTRELGHLTELRRRGFAPNPAQALVWALAGFSSDSELPFTGSGGPLIAVTSDRNRPNDFSLYTYNSNTDRENSLFDFPQGILQLPPSTNPQNQLDVYSVYRYEREQEPFVYFDSRTYLAARDANVDGTNDDMNGYNGGANRLDAVEGVRPYLSTNQSTATGALQFVNPKTFQLLGPGVDGAYATYYRNDAQPIAYYFQYPTGTMIQLPYSSAGQTGPPIPVSDANGNVLSNGYQESSYPPTTPALGNQINVVDNTQLDNVTNFCASTLGDDLEN